MIGDTINQLIVGFNSTVGGVLFWSNHPLKLPLILLVMVFGGIYFTFRYSFINVRYFLHSFQIIRGKYDKDHHHGQITHFQALTSSLSATIGLGNIASVAVAISLGGPGAVFWLWVVAFFGMSMKFSSCTLSQMYRRVKPDGSVLGGPMVYLEDGFREHYPRFKWLGKTFAISYAVFIIGGSLGAGNMFQANQTYEMLSSHVSFVNQAPGLIGLVLAFFVGLVILGGIKRIGNVTSKLVPGMCIFYVASCLAIILGNLSAVPAMFGEIFIQAFAPDAMWAGGFIGVLTQGVKRASFSNEAGLGSAAIAHAAAKTDRPVREGVVAMIGPFIDTHLVCTMTALVILITKAHLDPSMAGKGAAITGTAFATLGWLMPILLAVATVFFAYSTIISWSYYGERAWEYLFGERSIKVYQSIYVTCVALGPVLTLGAIIDMSDILLLSMAFPNIIGMVFLSKYVYRKCLRYDEDFREGFPELNDKANDSPNSSGAA